MSYKWDQESSLACPLYNCDIVLSFVVSVDYLDKLVDDLFPSKLEMHPLSFPSV